MRFDDLFRDLEAQLRAMEVNELVEQVNALAQAEYAEVELVDRLRAHRGHELSVMVRGGESCTGVLAAVGSSWLELEHEEAGITRCDMVPLLGITQLKNVVDSSRGASSAIERNLNINGMLRALSQQGRPLSLLLDHGESAGVWLSGTIRAVGSDFMDVLPTESSDAVVTVPIRQMLIIRLISAAY